MTTLPLAREEQLIVREMADELLVYDLKSHKAHCLNRTAALVWKQCDGGTTISGIAGKVGEQLSAEVPEEVVRLSLEELAELDLLAPGADRPGAPDLIPRREVVRRLGLAAAVALPLVTSIASPTPAQAQSATDCRTTGCPPGFSCVVIGDSATCELDV